MIRLTLPEKPVKLTADIEAAFVAEFKASGKEVWHVSYIKKPLLEMTAHKCAYCERQLGKGVNITMDHYVHKSQAPEKVVAWDNLLPCCQSCNSSKGTYDVLTDPFFNPVGTHIQAHLEMTPGGMFKGISVQGRAVIQRMKLNASDQKALPRFRLIKEMTEKLEECQKLCEKLEQVNTADERTELRNKVEALLLLTRRQSEFSAMAATVLLHDPRLEEAKQCLERLNDWNADLSQMLLNAQEIALTLRVKQV
jgi:hypothetical protein